MTDKICDESDKFKKHKERMKKALLFHYNTLTPSDPYFAVYDVLSLSTWELSKDETWELAKNIISNE